MHIPLSVKPNKQITSSTTYVYNRKRFHNIVLQVVCDCDFFLECGVANGRHFKMSSLYHYFQSRQILHELVVTIEGV